MIKERWKFMYRVKREDGTPWYIWQLVNGGPGNWATDGRPVDKFWAGTTVVPETRHVLAVGGAG